MELITGTQRRKLIAIGKNPPNNVTKPYISIIMPRIGHPSSNIATPPKKNRLPFRRSAWRKNLEDFSTPITRKSPVNNEQ